MPDNHTVFVRKPHADGLIEWRPSSASAQLSELLELLRGDPQLAYGDHIDLVEEATGRPVDPESRVDSLKGRTLAVRDRFVEYALHQLGVLQTQSTAVSYFELIPGSAVIRLELECSGLIERTTAGCRQLFVRGYHQLLVIIPQWFPDSAPRLIWLTPVFHPNLAADAEVWPPGFSWNENPNLVTLISALLDTLRGQLVATRAPWNLMGVKPLSPSASRFFRKNKRPIAEFARSEGLDSTGMPLASPGTTWRLDGALCGGRPMIFLSRRFHQGFVQFADYGPGWLVGKQGQWGGSGWYYVDRITPSYRGAVPPHDAIGMWQDGMSGWEPPLKGLRHPLYVEARDGRPVFRLSRESDEVGGYFVRHEASVPAVSAQSAVAAPKQPIRVASKGARWTRTVESEIMEPAEGTEDTGGSGVEEGQLVHQRLEPPLCIYCGSNCASDQEWGICQECDTVAHTECAEKLGGCPSTGCRRNPLYMP